MGYRDLVPHNMTANNVPSPFVASASGEYNGDFRAYKAFDGNPGTWDRWTPNARTGWLQIYLVTKCFLNNYTVSVGLIESEMDRAPQDWTLLGSNNGTTWDTLDTVTGQTGWTVGEQRNFVCDTQGTAYSYFRINISLNNGNTKYVHVRELYLYGIAETPGYVRMTNISGAVEYETSHADRLTNIAGAVEYETTHADRLSNIAGAVEFAPPHKDRITNILEIVEYEANHKDRVSSAVLMVEYKPQITYFLVSKNAKIGVSATKSILTPIHVLHPKNVSIRVGTSKTSQVVIVTPTPESRIFNVVFENRNEFIEIEDRNTYIQNENRTLEIT